MDTLDFSAFLRDKMKEHNMSLRRLSDVTGISIAHLELFLKGDMDDMPAAPYLRGYISHIAEALEFEPEIWWEYFKQIGVKSSGGKDSLPKNRFAPKPVSKHIWWIGALVLIAAYFGFRFTAIFGKPILTVEYPASEMIQVAESSVILRGQIKYGDQVFINSESIPLENNAWKKEVPLQPGLNSFEIKATKFLGRETISLRQIFYEPTRQVTSTTPTENASTTLQDGMNSQPSSTEE